jgi:hygromycin-B 7''-O-kinase
MLPLASTVAEYRSVCRDEALLRPGVDAICARHHAGGAIARFADGSLPVYAVGDARVLKLYPPIHRDECEVEASVLAAIAGKLPIATPVIDAVGELDGWGYVLMSRLRGESLATAWPRIDEAARVRLMAALGEGLAALHAVDAPALGPPDWEAFVREQRASAVERQRAKGLDEPWLAQLPGFLASLPVEASSRRVLLHTEIMREHLLVTESAGGWALSGLFDFEPAMRGAAEYELAAVGVFVSCGEPRYLRALLRAYGYRDAELDEGLARRLLGQAIVHRYSNLRWYLERLPALATPTLDALARCGWGT